MDPVVVRRPSDENGASDCFEEVHEPARTSTSPPALKVSKWKIVKDSNRRVLPRLSQGEIKLNSIIQDLQRFSVDEEVKSGETNKSKQLNCAQTARRKLAHYLRVPKFHYLIIVLVIVDLIVVLIDLVLAQLSSPCLTDDEMVQYNTTEQRDSCLLPHSHPLTYAEGFLFYFSLVVLLVFVFEIVLSFVAFGVRHYKNVLYIVDGCIVIASFILEIYFHFGNIGRAGRAAAAIIILRLWKIVRAIHAVAHSITLKNRMLIKKIQEAQAIIEEDKQSTEQLLERQDIQVEYLCGLLRSLGKLPTQENINNYIDSTWQQRKAAKC